MADTTIRVFLGIAVDSSSANSLSSATEVTGDYRTYDVKTKTNFLKVADITDFPEMIGDSEDIESTTMSDIQRTYEQGIQGTPTDSFTAQYSKEKYLEIQELVSKGRSRKYHFCLLISDSQSLFDWVGSINVGLGGGSINEIITMPLNISFATPVKLRKTTKAEYKDSTQIIEVENQT